MFYKSKINNQNVRLGLIAKKSCFEWSNKLKQLVSARFKVLEESISREATQNMQDVSNEKINTIYQPSKENRSNKDRPKNQTTKFKYMENSHISLGNQNLLIAKADTECEVNQSGLANKARISNVLTPSLTPSLTDTEEIDEEDMKEIFDEKKNCTGLWAGTPGSLEHHAPNQINELRLINQGSDCFVNCIIQLLRKTAYREFIIEHLQTLTNASDENFKLSKSLLQIYSHDFQSRPISAAEVRSQVAQYSGRFYMDNDTQQDAEEFFRLLEEALSEELLLLQEFHIVRSKHWGMEICSRRFLDNTATGKCSRCGNMPESKESPFLVLRITNIPSTSLNVSLTSLLQAHFSESSKVTLMRCSHCCEQQRHGKDKCNQVGVCQNKKTVEKFNITKYPEFLIIQLIRNVGDQPKLMTYVEVEEGHLDVNGHAYEMIGVVDHIGESPKSGHYITFLKDPDGNWILFNDGVNMTCQFKQVNGKNNYMFLFRRQYLDPNCQNYPEERQISSKKRSPNISNEDKDTKTNKKATA